GDLVGEVGADAGDRAQPLSAEDDRDVVREALEALARAAVGADAKWIGPADLEEVGHQPEEPEDLEVLHEGPATPRRVAGAAARNPEEAERRRHDGVDPGAMPRARRHRLNGHVAECREAGRATHDAGAQCGRLGPYSLGGRSPRGISAHVMTTPARLAR